MTNQSSSNNVPQKKQNPGPVEKSPASSQGDLSTGQKQARIFRNAYSGQRRSQITFPENGRTKQSFKAECDINTIMARYQKTGLLDHVRQVQGQYLDVTGADFAEAQNLVAGAKSMFHALPSHIRTKFENSPEVFFKFMENPANAQEAIELGLQTAQEEPSHPPSGAVPPAQPAASTQAAGVSPTGGSPTPATSGGQTIPNT